MVKTSWDKYYENFKKNPKTIIEWLEENLWWPIERVWEDITDIPRRIKWFVQRGKRGYADCDLWDLDGYLVGWLPEAIRKFRDTTHSYPGRGRANTPRKWSKILTRMANGLKAGREMTEGYPATKKAIRLEKEFNEGFKLFHKWFWSLWD